jgi:hypothetical protein
MRVRRRARHPGDLDLDDAWGVPFLFVVVLVVSALLVGVLVLGLLISSQRAPFHQVGIALAAIAGVALAAWLLLPFWAVVFSFVTVPLSILRGFYLLWEARVLRRYDVLSFVTARAEDEYSPHRPPPRLSRHANSLLLLALGGLIATWSLYLAAALNRNGVLPLCGVTLQLFVTVPVAYATRTESMMTLMTGGLGAGV